MKDDIRCPICGDETTIRVWKKDGRKYHFCINNPECKGKVPYRRSFGRMATAWIPHDIKDLISFISIFIAIFGVTIAITYFCFPQEDVFDVVSDMLLRAVLILCCSIITFAAIGSRAPKDKVDFRIAIIGFFTCAYMMTIFQYWG